MIEYVYAVKDELSGKYNSYGMFVNKAVAERNFKRDVNADGIPATDLMLYECGTFNHDTGIFDGYVTPLFIVRGEKVEVQE